MKEKITFLLRIIQTLALVMIAILLFRMELQTKSKVVNSQLEAQIKTKPITLNQNDAVWGNNDADFTLVAYIDYECPFCKDLYSNLKEIEEDYIKTGKVKVILRDLPLNMHAHAKKLAAASECARKNGKYWDLADLMLNNKEKYSDSLLYSWAEAIGITVVELEDCIADEKTIAIVQEDKDNARSRRLTGTPAVFINDKFYRGAIPVSDLKLIFEGKKPDKRKKSGSCNQ